MDIGYMRRALIISVLTLVGFVAGMAAGYLGVTYLSPNQHDRSLEAIMTAFFATGPLGAALGAIAAILATGHARREP